MYVFHLCTVSQHLNVQELCCMYIYLPSYRRQLCYDDNNLRENTHMSRRLSNVSRDDSETLVTCAPIAGLNKVSHPDSDRTGSAPEYRGTFGISVRTSDA